ncbi:hypothetical protein CEQ90_04820 [Lewinellaceae bacterium SD302]|nr:hypothetical protein CEQ90_04820 [Lewinellaceae bacterium SD302]
MKPTIALILFFLFPIVLNAQNGINKRSPFPVDFVVLGQSNEAGIYNYGTQASGQDPGWGPRLSEDVQGQLVWAYNAIDSLGCNSGGPIVTDLTGKMAFIRRGGCPYEEKVLNAQQAGAIGVVIANHFDDSNDTDTNVIDMVPIDSTSSSFVTTPAVFISRSTGRILQRAIDGCEKIDIKFDVKTFYDPQVAWAYRMPLNTYKPYRFSVNFVNTNEQDTVDVTVTAIIQSPFEVNVDTFRVTSSIAPLADSVITMAEEDLYVPTQTGTHTVLFTQDQSDLTQMAKFDVSNFTWGTDAIHDFTTDVRSVGPSQEQYDAAGGIYQSGNLVIIADEAEVSVANHVSFGLTNPQDFYNVFTGGERFEVYIYKGAFSNDDPIGFDDLLLVGGAWYDISPNDEPNDILYAELEEPVVLNPGEIYYVSVKKFAGLGSGVAPKFVGYVGNSYRTLSSADGSGKIFTAPYSLDQFYGEGWTDRVLWLRLHTDGFDPFGFGSCHFGTAPYLDTVCTVNTSDFSAMDQLRIAPNPVQEQLNVTLELNSAVSEALVRILDINGRVVGQYKYEQVTNAPIQIDVNSLQSGTYFLSVATPEGYRMKKFIKQ